MEHKEDCCSESREVRKVDNFINIYFKAVRGNNHEADEFTLVDLPLMNPFDWISILNIVSREPIKYEPISLHTKRLIKAYIVEITNLDVEISSVLIRRPIIKIIDPPKNLNFMKVGFIKNEN